MESRKDEVAVRRALQGEDAAFAELLERYQDRIFSFLLRLAGPAHAEDLAQETFLKAFSALGSYDPSRPFLSWLFRIAHNAAVDHLRARNPESLSLHDGEESGELASSEPGPEAELESLSQGELLERLLASLPPLYREPLLLRYKEGLELNEVARVLGLPEGTAKIRLFRARDMLKGKLRALGWGER